ncbi:hypothetical protein AB6E21_00180 [Photobacterium swingsii]|uniref:hypothetical protein n=1 Tax=Photobacterium swingsii TaxID=680026 RepID=UPI00355264C7
MKGSLLALLASLVVVIMENSPESVKSNLNKWLSAIGLNSDWLFSEFEKYSPVITPMTYVIIGVSLTFIITKMRKTKDTPEDPAVYNQAVTSYYQSGGITAHKVILGSEQRTLLPQLKQDLLNALDKHKKVDFSVAMNDQEAEKYAYEIRNFLIGEGYEMEFKTMQYEAMAGGQGIPYLNTKGAISIILIGPNVKTSEHIQFLGSACRPV